MTTSHRITRRSAVGTAVSMFLGATALPATRRDGTGAIRAVNVMNFIRAEEPRLEMDLVTPVREQMALLKQRGFPATWLFQYDALVEGPFVEIVKSEMPATHETGLWFEINRKLCDAAGVAWRGNKDWEWDYHVPVAYVIGYTPEERRKLAAAAMAGFKKVWGRTPKSVACWNLDALTMAQMSDEYGVEIFGCCRDQVSTDGFTVWGAPIGGYYPSRNNAWSPALNRANQINTPVVRLLGEDPVYCYDIDGAGKPDTMEPVWASGQNPTFVRRFLDMTAQSPCVSFAYAQLGQENSFGWPRVKQGYALQLSELARVREQVRVETMSETGRRFRQAYAFTPAHAQVQLSDPFGRTDPGERTVWYQSRFYRANLHFRGEDAYLRDITVYSDRFPQPFLRTPTRQNDIEQRLPAVLDGRHWSAGARRALAFFGLRHSDASQTRLRLKGIPRVAENGSSLDVSLDMDGGIALTCSFGDRGITVRASGMPSHAVLALIFEWSPDRTAFRQATGSRADYRFEGFDYGFEVTRGKLKSATAGLVVEDQGGVIYLTLAQKI